MANSTQAAKASTSNQANNNGSNDLSENYLTHLNRVNEKKPVLATENIYNAQGALLVPEGQVVKASVTRQLLAHKLAKPLESSIAIEGTIDAKSLFTHCQDIFAKRPDSDLVYSSSNIASTLKTLCGLAAQQPILMQKLTVLEQEIPAEYESSVFSAVLSTIMAKEKAVDSKTLACAFFAGLFHDIGILHLPRSALPGENALSAAERKLYQGHSSISRFILNDLAKLPKLASDAVFEHHERCDGTGYPLGRSADKLGNLGQLVGLADSLTAIYYHQLQPEGRNLNATLPFLRLNANTYTGENYQAAIKVFLKSGVKKENALNDDTIEAFNKNLLGEMQRLLHWSKLTADVIPVLESLEKDQDKEAGRLLRHVNTIWHNIKQSGVLSDGLTQWIEHVAVEKISDAYEEMDELWLMQKELHWHYRDFHQRLTLHVNGPEKAGNPIIDILQKITVLMADLDASDAKYSDEECLDIRTIMMKEP